MNLESWAAYSDSKESGHAHLIVGAGVRIDPFGGQQSTPYFLIKDSFVKEAPLYKVRATDLLPRVFGIYSILKMKKN